MSPHDSFPTTASRSVQPFLQHPYTHTMPTHTTTTILWPGKPLPEEMFTHTAVSTILYQLKGSKGF